MFHALLIEKNDDNYQTRLTELDDSQLPEGDVTVRVEYSTLNYKDGLAISGRSPVVRRFPMVPGIDLAGVVEASDHARSKVGDQSVRATSRERVCQYVENQGVQATKK